MTEQLEETKARPWQWPGEWMKDEKFWKDVASRTLSGVLVVVIGLIYAGAAGYITSPDIRGFLVGLGMTAVFWIIGFTILIKQAIPPLRQAAATKINRKGNLAVGIIMSLLYTMICVGGMVFSILIATIVNF